MAAGSAVGREPMLYYQLDANSTPRGSKNCTTTDQCGMDLLDGWPWQHRWAGKGGSEGNWILHFQVPFSSSVRITAQVASEATDPAFARPDIKAGTQVAAYFMTSGLVGPEEQLGVTLGGGLIKLPFIGTDRLRLRLARMEPVAPQASEVVTLLDWEQQAPGVNESGAILMTSVVFEGMHTVNGDVEMCFWVANEVGMDFVGATEDNHPLLVGTGMEDFFANAFSLSDLSRNYYSDDAGVPHIHGGPLPGRVGGPSFDNYPSMFSAYRMWYKDPMLFHGKAGIATRYIPPGGEKGKCSLPAKEEVGRHARFDRARRKGRMRVPRDHAGAAKRVALSAYTFYYTWVD